MLLLLMLHAVQAGAAHFPRLARTTTRTVHALTSVENFEANAATESGSHAQCLLCRLQRNLSTGLKNFAPVAFLPPHDSLLAESTSADDPHATPPVETPGRAPPRS